MEDCLICPFCHAIVLPIEFDGGWKCECVRCEYTSREGDTKDEAIEMHMELQSKEADASVLRALVGELADALLAACNDTCDYCKKHLNFSEATASICLYNHQCNVGQAYGRLVAKAKEAVK